MSDLYQNASYLKSNLQKGLYTAEDLTRLHLDRIQTHNPALNAIVVDTSQRALNQAKKLDALKPELEGLPPLFGIPVTIKECFKMSATPTTINFPPLKHYRADKDSIFVERLEAAGAIILGKTNVPSMLADSQTFGPLYPTCNNPYDLTRTPGGSTGGGASSLAAGFACIEIGSDIGGSIRNPSHYCGLYGLKPSQNGHLQDGHVPPLPNSSMGFSALNSTGPMARNMTDLELAYQVCYAPRPEFRKFPQLKNECTLTDLQGLKVAYFDQLLYLKAGQDVQNGMQKLLKNLESQGAEITQIRLDDSFVNKIVETWAKLFGFVAGQDFNWLIRLIMKLKFGKDARASRLDFGSALNDGLSLNFKKFSHALAQQQELISEYYRYFDDFDVIVSPTSPGPAFHHNHKHQPIRLDGEPIPYVDYCFLYVMLYNALELPVLNVPTGLNGEGLPVGVSIAAPHFQEAKLLKLGKLIEENGFEFIPPEL